MPDDVFIIDDNDRYARFRLISWWDQSKLLASKVLVVGAGALGNEVLKNLALLGVGHILVVDFDEIEDSNLTRSVLFRASDRGKSKAEIAAARTRDMNPDCKVIGINSDIMKLGLGVFRDVDLVLGCLDNREARLWVNRQCWKVTRPWIDSAIQELMGVVKLFVPPDSSCYECAMTEMDYRLINLRYSCPLLKREDILEGKTPTTPTISSIAAGLQTQEALKMLHGSKVQDGSALIFNGTGNTFYSTQFVRREDCLSHLTYREVKDLPVRSNYTLKTFFEAVRHQLKLPDPIELILDRELLLRFACRTCGHSEEVMRLLMDVTVRQGLCPQCQTPMLADTTHLLTPDSKMEKYTLDRLGVPAYDIVRVRSGGAVHAVALAADREKVIDWTIKP